MKNKNILYFILFTLSLISFRADAQFSRQMFGRLNIEDGLSQSVVQAIVQDKYGFMWFGTNDGLNKFDGYNFKVFRKNEGLSDGAVKSLLTVNDTLLWIGTRYAGINILNLKTNRIIKYINTSNSNLNSNNISFMKEDEKGRIWVGSDNGVNLVFNNYTVTSMFKNPGNIRESVNNFFIINSHNVWFSKEFTGVYNYLNGKIIKYDILNDKPLKSFDNVLIDRHGTIWLGSNNGLFYKKKNDAVFKQKVLESPFTKDFQIHHIFIDHEDNLWFSIHTLGLYKLNLTSGKITTFSDKTQNANRFDLITTVSSCVDRAGMIWVGTNGHGLQYFYPSPGFQTVSYDLNSDFHTSGRSIRKITRNISDSNLIWVASYGGLDLIDKRKGLVKNYNRIKDGALKMKSDAIYDIFHDSETGNVFLGTEGKGLIIFDPVKNEFISPIYHDKTKFFELNYKVFKDQEGEIWLGTNNGLFSYNKKNNTIYPVYNPVQELLRFNICDISAIDKQLLLATNKGLYVYDKRYRLCKNVSLNLGLVSEPNINSILIENNTIWFCTSGNGLLKYEFSMMNNSLIDLTFKAAYNTKNGMPNDVVYGILKDNSDNYWMSTNKGLVRLNEKNNELSIYNYNDGLQGNEFNSNSYFKDADGTLYFGGINGLSYFNPATLRKNTTIPIISFTSFKIFNNAVDSDYNLNEISKLVIPYSDNVLTFSFTSSDYVSNKRLSYAYRLEGFNPALIQLGNVNNVTFTNLDPGEYVLKVTGTNSDGIWNHEGRSLKIKVVPPFWKTIWFAAYCIVLAGALIYVFFRMRIKNIALANIKLEREVNNRTIELSVKNKELGLARDAAEKSDQAKSEFLATMSHEIRTPMNGVVGMVSLLENASLNPVQKNYVEIIRTSTDNLLQVINDILDFSKIDSGKLDLFIESVNIHKLLETCVELFLPRANEKNIEIITSISASVPDIILADETRLKQVLFNLLNNALKFTASGHVHIEVDSIKNTGADEITLRFKVTDTGIGIPPEKQTHIFQLFTQADSSTSRKFGGTGLGLTICKRLVELMNGEITVSSASGKGAEFTFTVQAGIIYQADKRTYRPLFDKAVLSFQHALAQQSCKAYLSELNLECISYAHNAEELLINNNNLLFITDNDAVAAELNTYKARYSFRLVYFYGQGYEPVKADLFIQKPLTRNKLVKLISETSPVQINRGNKPEQARLSQKYPLRILVAEDYSINQIILNKMFQSLGYPIVMVENGLEALNEAQKNTYDIVFMDVHMPEMDGVQATRLIIEQLGDQAPLIIALTASVINNEIHEYKEAGMQDILAKPLALEDLKNCLIKWGELLKQKK